MTVLSSLQNRIFLASALLAVVPLAAVLQFVGARVTREAEEQLRRSVAGSATLVEQHHATRLETLTAMAHLVADLPRLKAAVATGDPPTVRPLCLDYMSRVRSDVFVVTDRGKVLVAIGVSDSELARSPAVASALEGRDGSSFRIESDRLLEIVTVPLSIGPDPPEILGTLSLGFALDDALAAHFKAVTGSEVAFLLEGRVLASTMPREAPALTRTPAATEAGLGGLETGEYVALTRPLAPGTALGPIAVVFRSRAESLRFVRTLHTVLAVTALAAVGVAVLLGYALARTVTRPLAAVTGAMSEVAATGDLTRKILPGRSWDDEDARVLVRTFNLLTDSIARFQHEASERERLSALGRLSTVIAHEVRNPLMIIKASLRTLRRDDLLPDERREPVSDIDHEVARLDRIVGDVLDFARPPRIECAPTDLNDLCREAVQATLAGESRPLLSLALDPALRPIVTDGERLRTVLLNVLTNARESVLARGEEGEARAGEADIEVRTAAHPPGRVTVVVSDRGEGIDPAHLAHVFEPYFTTRRTGTGLGLAIAESIVAALGGTISARSRPGDGTEITIDLPERGPSPSPSDLSDAARAARLPTRA